MQLRTSGWVPAASCLPNHAPLAVAEQFALLEGRRAGDASTSGSPCPGSDPVTSVMLRGSRDDAGDVAIDNFLRHLDEITCGHDEARRVRVELPPRPRQPDAMS